MPRTRSFRLILAVAAALLAPGVASAERLPTTPTPLPADRDPCALFTADAEYISQTLIMDLEGRRVPIRVPAAYFEDTWDRTQGFSDTSQLFQVEIGSFLPVSRSETARRNKQDIWNWMTFLIGDRIPVEEVAIYSAEHWSNVIGGTLENELLSYDSLPGPFGLSEIKSDAPQPTASFRTNTYLAWEQDGSLTSVVSCNVPGSVLSPVCQHWFRASGMDVQLSYRRTELPNWRALQTDVSTFLTCATAP